MLVIGDRRRGDWVTRRWGDEEMGRKGEEVIS